MGNTFYFGFEEALMRWLQSVMGSAAVTVASVLTMLGEEMLLIAIMGFLYWCWNKELGKFVGTNIVFAMTLNPMIKNVVLRRRPYFDLAGVECLKTVDVDADVYDIAAQGWSFPSGHSMNSACVYGSIAAYERRSKILWIIAIAAPFLVGVSRVLLGVHYPTDVLAGWICGAIVVFALSKLQRSVKDQWKLRLALFLIALTGVIWCRTDDYFTSLGTMAGFFLGSQFEEKFVNFKGTRNVLKIILRMLGGLLLYFGLNYVLKMPFDAAFLASSTLPAFLVRSARYTVILFVVVGVYPLIFDRVNRKKSVK